MRSARAVSLNGCAVLERKDDLAAALDKDALDRAAVAAFEIEDEVDRLLDVGPVQALEGRALQQRGEALCGRGGPASRARRAAAGRSG